MKEVLRKNDFFETINQDVIVAKQAIKYLSVAKGRKELYEIRAWIGENDYVILKEYKNIDTARKWMKNIKL